MYEAIAHPVQCLQIELIIRLNGNETHVLTCHRFGNRFRIIEIILVGLDEWLHELPRDELHLMSLIAQLGGKEMRARAGFHPDD